jgi:tetratricopeptide (TPR) repeat protein
MATLETQHFSFEPDMKIIREQCEEVVRRDPALAGKVSAAMKSFGEAKKFVDQGDVKMSIQKLSESMEKLIDLGLDEVEAACYFYTGFLALLVGNEELGIELLNEATRKTKDPWLALGAYNRLMVQHLSNNDFDIVMRLADATEKVVSGLSVSKASLYFACGASYNRGEAHFRRHDHQGAMPHVQSALEGFLSLSMKEETAKCQGLLGNALIASGELKRGLDATEEALRLFRELGNEGEGAFLLQGKGMAMARMGDKSAALASFREALKLFRHLDDTTGINSTLAIIAGLEAAD